MSEIKPADGSPVSLNSFFLPFFLRLDAETTVYARIEAGTVSYLEELPILLMLAPSAVLFCSLDKSQSVMSHSEVSESLNLEVVDGGLR